MHQRKLQAGLPVLFPLATGSDCSWELVPLDLPWLNRSGSPKAKLPSWEWPKVKDLSMQGQRPKPPLPLHTTQKGYSAFRTAYGIGWSFCCSCTTVQQLNFFNPALLPSFPRCCWCHEHFPFVHANIPLRVFLLVSKREGSEIFTNLQVKLSCHRFIDFWQKTQ